MFVLHTLCNELSWLEVSL